MFYSLAHLEDEFHADNVHKVVQLAPCFVAGAWPDNGMSIQDVNDIYSQVIDNGVYATNGPNWEKDLQTICDNNSQ